MRTETLGSVISERLKDSMLLAKEVEGLPCRGLYGVYRSRCLDSVSDPPCLQCDSNVLVAEAASVGEMDERPNVQPTPKSGFLVSH